MPPSCFLFDPEQGGALNDIGSYALGFILGLCEDPITDVKSTLKVRKGIEEYFSADLVFSGGYTAFAEGAIDRRTDRTALIQGTKGKIAGVGRKSANVIMLEVFGIAEGVAVDTHAKRISNLTGLSKEKEPEKIEQDLLKIFPKECWKDLNHLLVWHGRNTCIARNPKCNICPISNVCKFAKSKK